MRKDSIYLKIKDVKLEDLLEIENTCNGRILRYPCIMKGHINAPKNSILDGTWKVTKKRVFRVEGARL